MENKKNNAVVIATLKSVNIDVDNNIFIELRKRSDTQRIVERLRELIDKDVYMNIEEFSSYAWKAGRNRINDVNN